MKDRSTFRFLFLFTLKFCLHSLVLVPLWWLCLPGYGWLLLQGCGWALKHLFGAPILAGQIDVAGILNTQSELVFHLADRERRMEFALLVTNLPPFVTLVLATPGLGGIRRLKVLAAGSGVLVACHALFIVVVFQWSASLLAIGELSTAASQFLLTLPFLLWIVLAYWSPERKDNKDT